MVSGQWALPNTSNTSKIVHSPCKVFITHTCAKHAVSNHLLGTSLRESQDVYTAVSQCALRSKRRRDTVVDSKRIMANKACQITRSVCNK